MKKMVFAMVAALAMGASAQCACCDGGKPLFGCKLDAADCDKNVWSMSEDGVLSANKDSAIWTKDKIGDCTVTFDYKLSAKANAGFLIKCSNKGDWVPNTIEIQLLDDAGSSPNYHGNAAFYGYQAPTKVVTKPAGEWNSMKVECRGPVIKVWLNGEFVNEMNMSEWKDAKVSPRGTEIEAKFQGKALANADTTGYMGFQGQHGKSTVFYRNIKIAK